MEAFSQDEMVARGMVEPEDTKPRRRMVEYSVEVEMLSTLVDRMAEMIAAVVASRGVKPRHIPPAPRPVTAYERLRKEQRKSTHESLVARLLPNKGKQPAPERPQVAVKAQPPARAGRVDRQVVNKKVGFGS